MQRAPSRSLTPSKQTPFDAVELSPIFSRKVVRKLLKSSSHISNPSEEDSNNDEDSFSETPSQQVEIDAKVPTYQVPIKQAELQAPPQRPPPTPKEKSPSSSFKVSSPEKSPKRSESGNFEGKRENIKRYLFIVKETINILARKLALRQNVVLVCCLLIKLDLIGWHNVPQAQLHPVKRYGHSCVAFRSSIILYGGYSGQPIGDMWFFDTSTNFSQCFSDW